MRFETVQEIYEVFQRDCPTEWVMTEEEYLHVCRFGVRAPVVPATVRRGGRGEPPIVVEEAIYHPDEYYEDQWLDDLHAGRARLLGKPIRVVDA